MCASGAVDSARAQTVVLQASGPSASKFPQGSVLPDTAHIQLVEGDSLSVMFSGSTHQVRGPYSGPARISRQNDTAEMDWAPVLRPMPRTRSAATRSAIKAASPAESKPAD